MRLCFFLLTVLGFLAIAESETLLVPSEYPDIAEAIDAAESGDTVLIACGVYPAHDLVVDSKQIVIRSATGQADCVTIDVEGYDSFLKGTSLTGNFRLEGLTFFNSHKEVLYFDGGAAEVRGCLFNDNGRGVIDNEGFTKVTRCTFWGTLGPCISAYGEGFPDVRRCIFWENAGAIVYEHPFASVSIECSDIEGGWPGQDNIIADPLFCESSIGNFNLQMDSPCIAENNDCGELMGAFPAGCSISTKELDWGMIKRLY